MASPAALTGLVASAECLTIVWQDGRARGFAGAPQLVDAAAAGWPGLPEWRAGAGDRAPRGDAFGRARARDQLRPDVRRSLRAATREPRLFRSRARPAHRQPLS